MDLYLHLGIQVFSNRIGRRHSIKENLMDLYLQFGYGMMDHSRSLIKEWGGGSVILSPRDLNELQLQTISKEIRKLNGSVLLDPQFYLPYADHERLSSHSYWPDEYESTDFWSGSHLSSLLSKLLALNLQLGCTDFILPGLYASTIDDDWLYRQKTFIEEAERLCIGQLKLLTTVTLSAEAIQNEEHIHKILEAADGWSVDGIYLVCEHPQGEYLVSNPSWLANILDLTAGFRLKGKRVIIGYCNQQMLIAACAAASGIASGTWMNVRSFLPEKFRTKYEEEIKRRNTWYYCPEALSEFKIPYLDIALRQGVLDELAPNKTNNSTYADILFQGPQPTTVSFTEQIAFRHYLQCLRSQVFHTKKSTFDESVKFHQEILLIAEKKLQRLHTLSIQGQNRDFGEAIDANRAALSVLQKTRGPRLRRYWSNLFN
jgi:hypothetical protein